MSALLTYLRRKITGQARGATDYVASAGLGVVLIPRLHPVSPCGDVGCKKRIRRICTMSVIPFDQRDGVIWFDGKLVPWKEAKVHVLTHGLHYGSCIFEGERA